MTSSELQKWVSWYEVRSCCIMLCTILYFSEKTEKNSRRYKNVKDKESTLRETKYKNLSMWIDIEMGRNYLWCVGEGWQKD